MTPRANDRPVIEDGESGAFPENRNYGCVDCGSINHTTGDVAWCRVAQGRLRSQAVENVDARYGYTWEFSNQPNAHLAEYDEEEARLMQQAKGQ